MQVQTHPPRRVGLLAEVHARRARVRDAFPYAVDDRIAGDLTVIGHLAAGRYGHLYQVWSAREWCAFTCKIVAPERLESRRARAALRREQRLLRRVEHPNVVHSFGGGEHDGLPFLLMEYLDGPSLLDVLEHAPGRRLPPEDAVRAAMHIGAGLYHLHRAGYLYLDLKPANLLLRGRVPVLVDFDTVRRADAASRPRDAIGTAPYMSPEQVLREPPTEASDVYGLGAVLYELLTGRWPFEAVYQGEEPRSGEERDYPQIGPTPPEPVTAFAPDVPASLERAVTRCLARDPRERWPGLHPLLLALSAELDGPAALWPPGVSTERRRSPRH